VFRCLSYYQKLQIFVTYTIYILATYYRSFLAVHVNYFVAF
jgi:hypothetical protein